MESPKSGQNLATKQQQIIKNFFPLLNHLCSCWTNVLYGRFYPNLTFSLIMYFLDCFLIRWLKIMLEDGRSLCHSFRFFRRHFAVLHQPVHHSQMNVSTYNMFWVALLCKYSLLLIKVFFFWSDNWFLIFFFFFFCRQNLS